MPYEDPSPDDPHELIGVQVAGDQESVREMAYTFAEEFAALGFDEKRLVRLFRQPFNRAAHQAYQVLGEPEVRKIIRECLELWGRFRVVVIDNEPSQDEARPRLVQIGPQRPVIGPIPRASRQEDE